MARPAFRGAAAHIRVPATSANLGPGFDAFGLALSLCDDVVARVGEDSVQVDVAGEGAATVARDETNLVIRAMRTTFDELGGQPRGIELSCANRIPHGRGLGSSAAAIVAGVLLARAVVLGGDELMPDSAVLTLASRIEGHPDNVAACLFGGFTIAWTTTDDRIGVVRLDVDSSVVPVAFIPPGESSTEQARQALPASVPHADATFNVARAALLVAALTGHPELLFDATDDRLHQGYRAAGAPTSFTLMQALRADGIAALVSGAGPTVLALARDESDAARARTACPDGWTLAPVVIEATGAQLVR